MGVTTAVLTVQPDDRESARPDGMEGQGLGFQGGQVQASGCLVDVEANHLPISIQIDVQPVSDLNCLGPGLRRELDVQAISLRIIVQLHDSCSVRSEELSGPLL